MTLGIFVPLIATVLAIVVTLIGLKRIAAAQMAAADIANRRDESVAIRTEWIKIVAAWILPVALYIVFNMLNVGDIATLKIF
ncbi:hypothetical protein [Sphingopyxis sp.]|uniref:hypothetical protein n=1 Tax=Sphingopyxis sp. TaxID=1908224 RepID=UPI002FCC2814